MGDLVGDLGKQKKIGKITGKTPEAKGTNYVIGCYKKIATVASPNVTNRLLTPLREKLLSSIDQKEHLAIFNALQAISEGFLQNPAFTSEYLIALTASILGESLLKKKESQNVENIERLGEKTQSCLLLDQPVKRGGIKAKLNTVTNRHYLNQFALRLFNSALKTGKVEISDNSPLLPKIDGVIEMLGSLLDTSRHADESCHIFRILGRLVKQDWSKIYICDHIHVVLLFFIIFHQMIGRICHFE